MKNKPVPKLLFTLLVYMGWLVTCLVFTACKKENACAHCTGNNEPPIAIAGPDQAITLPTDSVVLDGSNSSDPDGKISAWRWAYISGPASYTMADSTAEKTTVKNLKFGFYQFELKVTDQAGLFATDTVLITVDSLPANFPPADTVASELTVIGKLSEARIPAVGAAGSKVVFAGGVRKSICDEWDLSSAAVDIYDINTHLWTTETLSKERSGISVASIGDKIFFAGGTNWVDHGGWASYSTFDNIDIYNATTNTWSVAHLSQPRSSMAVSVVGNKVIFAGGYYFTDDPNPNAQRLYVSNTVDIYDASTSTWSTAKLSVPRYGISTVVAGDNVYFAGGIGYGSDNPNIVDVYNSSANTWTTSNLPEDIALIASSQISNYVVWNDQNYIQIKNIDNGTTIRRGISGPAFNLSGLKNNEIVFFTGIDGNNGALKQIEIYNTATGNWFVSNLTQRFNGTAAAGVITFKNTTYLAGGVSVNNGCQYNYTDKVYTLSW